MAEQFANDPGTALDGAVTDSQGTVSVADATGYPEPPFRIRINDELMLVTGKSGTGDVDWSVDRGIEGTSPSAHATGDDVNHVVTANALPWFLNENDLNNWLDDPVNSVTLATSPLLTATMLSGLYFIELLYASSEAMLAVGNSEMALNAIISTSLALPPLGSSSPALRGIAAGSPGMTKVYDSATALEELFSVSFPETISNATLTHATDRLRFTRNSAALTEEFISPSASIDFTGFSTMRFNARADTLGDNQGHMRGRVRIGGSQVLSLLGNQTTYSERVIDVSSISGLQSVQFGFYSSTSGGSQPYIVEFGPFKLEA